MVPTDVDAIFDRRAVSGVLRVPAASDHPRETDRREGVRATHWIIGKNAVQRERVLPADGQRAEGSGADAEETLGIVELPSTARIAVRGLPVDRHADIIEL